MARIRVIIVDDSATMRTLLGSIVDSDPHLQLIGEAYNGAEAVRLVAEQKPDLVLMDVNMPVMDGLQATREIMARTPTPIIIVSALVSTDIRLAFSATEAGALFALPKPPAPNHPTFAAHREELLRMSRAMAGVKVVRHFLRSEPTSVTPPVMPFAVGQRTIKLIAIGTSTGGPAALHQIFSDLPGDFAVPIVVVQHISTGFAHSFCEWLDRSCPLSVTMVLKPTRLEPGHVYIASEDHHLGVRADFCLDLSSNPAIGGFRPSATHLFETAGRAFGRSLAAVILTGMGRDGVDGLRTAHAHGALVIAQDEASSIIYGMPKEALAAGVVDHVLPLDSIAAQLRSIVS